MKTLFVTATNTNVGKTYTTIKLIESFAQQGILVGVCKPIETGVQQEAPDATLLLETVQKYNPNFKTLAPTDITAYTFPLPAAPFCADREQIITIKTITDKIKELSKLCDLLIVEGAGGLFVPITKSYNMIDLAQELNGMTLLVTPSKLGCINDTQLSIKALKSRAIPFEWCVNLFEDKETFKEVTQPYYDAVYNGWWSVEQSLDAFTKRVISNLLT